jgi:hypothetical protein
VGLRSEWGKIWVDGANKEHQERAKECGIEAVLVEDTGEGLRRAPHNGSLVIRFTIMKCIGYKRDLYERLLYYKVNPKPPKSASKKRRKATSSGQGRVPVKKSKGSRKGKCEDSDEQWGDEGDYHSDDDGDDDGLGDEVNMTACKFAPRLRANKMGVFRRELSADVECLYLVSYKMTR